MSGSSLKKFAALRNSSLALPLVRTLLETGRLRGIQIGGRGMWRVAPKNIEDYIDQAYRATAEGIAIGEVADDHNDYGLAKPIS